MPSGLLFQINKIYVNFIYFSDSRLVSRFLSGQKPLYKPIDYGQLAALTKIKKSAGERSLKKIEKLAQLNKDNKEHQMLQEHRRVWEIELHKLSTLSDKIQQEINELRPETPNYSKSTNPRGELYEEINDYEDSLDNETKEFIKGTLQPVLDLTEDIKGWIQQHSNQLTLGVYNKLEQDDIKQVIDSVKQQQCNIISKLAEESNKIEEEIQEFICGINLHTNEAALPIIEIGIPEGLIRLECPDEDLRVSCFKEFDELNQKYVELLEELEKKFQNINRK